MGASGRPSNTPPPPREPSSRRSGELWHSIRSLSRSAFAGSSGPACARSTTCASCAAGRRATPTTDGWRRRCSGEYARCIPGSSRTRASWTSVRLTSSNAAHRSAASTARSRSCAARQTDSLRAMGLLIVHGGAGAPHPDEYDHRQSAVGRALDAGWEALAEGALEAVVAAVRSLEDEPALNAGIGASLNRDGDVELDAGLMEGTTLRAGAVGAVRDVRHPVDLARAVME